MNGIDSGQISKKRIISIECMHPVWYNTGMPVIAMHNIRRPVQSAYGFQSCTAEKNKTLPIIRITINIFAVKEARRINHVHRDMIPNLSLPHAYLHLEIPDTHRNGIKNGCEMKALRINLPVARHNQAYIMS